MSKQYGAYRAPLGIGSGAGGVLSLANPEGVTLLVTRLTLHITTPATGVPTVDAGVAADGSTSSDTLIDGQAVGDAAKVLDNIDDKGTNGQATEEWGVSEYLTISASEDPAGLVGYAYIEYLRTD